MKRCLRCGVEKPATAFYRNRSNNDGLQNRCKPCHVAGNRDARARNPEHYRAAVKARAKPRPYSFDPHKKAHKAVNRAIKRGDLVRPGQCEHCRRTGVKIYGHHEDYDKPLEVRWLCQRCHLRLHAGVLEPAEEARAA